MQRIQLISIEDSDSVEDLYRDWSQAEIKERSAKNLVCRPINVAKSYFSSDSTENLKKKFYERKKVDSLLGDGLSFLVQSIRFPDDTQEIFLPWSIGLQFIYRGTPVICSVVSCSDFLLRQNISFKEKQKNTFLVLNLLLQEFSFSINFPKRRPGLTHDLFINLFSNNLIFYERDLPNSEKLYCYYFYKNKLEMNLLHDECFQKTKGFLGTAFNSGLRVQDKALEIYDYIYEKMKPEEIPISHKSL